MQSTKNNNNHITFQIRCNQLNTITITSYLQIKLNSDHTLVEMHIIFKSIHSKHNPVYRQGTMQVTCQDFS